MPPRSTAGASRKRRLSELAVCPHCDKDDLSWRGFANHERTCRGKRQASAPEQLEAQALMFAAEREAAAAFHSAILAPLQQANVPAPHQPLADIQDEMFDMDVNADNVGFDNVPALDNPQLGNNQALLEDEPNVDQAPRPEVNDVKIEYHPHSQRPHDLNPFDSDDLPAADAHDNSKAPPLPPEPMEKEPWRPFSTRLDFEFSELMLQARMNEKQRGRLLALVQEAIQKPEDFTLKSAGQLEKTWEQARSYRGVEFTRKDMPLLYNGETLDYEVWSRSLWDWCEDLLTNHNLSSKFHWDAEKNYKFNGERYERFVDEPWTADDWWNIQSKLPDLPNAKPLCLIVYADKTRLSSFGTAKGYPVIARIANLPAELRNGRGIAGGRLVGWLPIEDEKVSEHGKKAYVDFKRIIWHRGFDEILRSTAEISKIGFTILCDDGVERTLYPRILILSADYEEQCTMALVRGWGSTFGPCPVCLIPEEHLMDLRTDFPLRTTQAMQTVWKTAKAQRTIAAKEQILKSHGLRDVENAFWKLQDTDVYAALSWDRLHAYHIGMFSDHLLAILRVQLDAQGRAALTQVDAYLDSIPPWSGLNHFSSLSKSSEFADGRKHEDLSKVIIFATLDVLKSTIPETRAGYHALRLIRSYLELDMFSSLTVQTESSIAAGEAELLNFGELVQSFSELYPDLKEIWGFPKMHTHTHMFRDIRSKGVTRNYNTKYNEREHGPLKMYYRLQSNFKQVGKQIAKLDDYNLIAISIRHSITDLDEYTLAVQKHQDDQNNSAEDVLTAGLVIRGTAHVSVGSRYPGNPLTLKEAELLTVNGHPFSNFRKKLSLCMSGILGVNIKLPPDYEIIPYRYLRVSYECKVSWNVETDILRANPDFFGRPRYDFILAHAREDDHIIGQLLYIFSIHVSGKTHYMALIHPYDIPASLFNRRRDAELQLTRVRARPRQSAARNATESQAVFISVESIVRGCLLVPDPSSPTKDEYFVVNFIDQDMWMRMKSLKLGYRVNLD